MNRKILSLLFVLLFAVITGLAQNAGKAIPAGAKVFISPINDGFE